MKKQLSYFFSILLAVITVILPAVFLVIYGIRHHFVWLCLAGGSLVFAIALYTPLAAWRRHARMASQTDEFGNSKRKTYDRLSQKERDMIDLQKTADAERIVGSATLAKLTHEGSKNPQADLDNLIGLRSVKQRVAEMAAKMEFEKQEKKSKGKKYVSPFESGHHAVYFGAPGTGKAQPLYSKVLTPNGFRMMGNIRVGDTVIAGDGSPATVLGVYPQGKKSIYELTFDDGAKCRCSYEHLWTVQTSEDRDSGTVRTLPLYEMLKVSADDVHSLHTRTYGPNRTYSIPCAPPIPFPQKNYLIPPYLMGLMLGSKNPCGHTLSLPCDIKPEDILRVLPDDGYTMAFRQKTSETCVYRLLFHGKAEPVSNALRQFGIMHALPHEKYIPTIYLSGSIEQRQWLMRGLLDAAGEPHDDCILFETLSPMLRDDILTLVRSLGGYANYQSIAGLYRLSLRFANAAEMFHAKNKTKQCPVHNAANRFLKEIRYVGEEECQCIYIDNPTHLYITDDYLLTHNTTIARIMTGFLYKYGYIKENKVTEIDGNFLKAGAETAAKTTMVVRRAFGGVLFIDEAYALAQGDMYGRDAIATLIKQMEDNRDRFVLILAGYTDEMRELLETNPGFESRCKEYLYFEDYDDADMVTIFKHMAKSKGYTVDSFAEPNLRKRIDAERHLKSFGNARTARSILDEAIEKHAYHFISQHLPNEKRYILSAEDISPTPRTI